jgi:hypothetical protein
MTAALNTDMLLATDVARLARLKADCAVAAFLATTMAQMLDVPMGDALLVLCTIPENMCRAVTKPATEAPVLC